MSRQGQPDGSSGHLNMTLPCPPTSQSVGAEPVVSCSNSSLLLMQDPSRTWPDSMPRQNLICMTTDDFCSYDTPGCSIFAEPLPVISPTLPALPPPVSDIAPAASLDMLPVPLFPPSTGVIPRSESLLLPSPTGLRPREEFRYCPILEWTIHPDDETSSSAFSTSAPLALPAKYALLSKPHTPESWLFDLSTTQECAASAAGPGPPIPNDWHDCAQTDDSGIVSTLPE